METPSQTGATPARGVPWKLSDDFPVPAYADWRKAVDVELKGAPFDKRMLTRTYEGITLQPIYRKEDNAGISHLGSLPGFAPFVRGTRASGYLTGPWDVSQEIGESSAADFNTSARGCLARGLTGLNVVLDKATRAGQDPDWAAEGAIGVGGLSIATLDDLMRALDGIDLAATSLFVRSGASAAPFAALLAALCAKRGIPTKQLRGCIEMDPIGVLAHEGCLPQSLSQAYTEMAELMSWASVEAPQLKTACVHTRAWHEAGGSAVQELAFGLATGVEYLREMQARGLGPDAAAPRVRFAITVGTNLFMEIAKLRAARMLWATAVAAAGGGAEPQKLNLHVRTSLWNKTALDPYVNLLRGTVEAFGAAIGGCDSLQVGAFDEVVRPPDHLSQRLARNTQIILQKECDLARVMDPAGGSWYVESLTASLAKDAWALFQEVERRGGMAKAMASGYPQAEVARIADEKLKAVAQRRDVIVGSNQYANPREKALPRPVVDTAEFARKRARQVADYRTSEEAAQSTAVLKALAHIVESATGTRFAACVSAAAAGATLGEITRSFRLQDSVAASAPAVKLQRASQAFERIRAAVECQAAGPKGRPKVFLANMGPLAQHKARADFSRGFFSVGGFETIYPRGFPDPAAAATEAIASGAAVIVICSTDETYPAIVPAFVSAVKSADPSRYVILAGYPQDQVEAHKKSGVDDFVHVRVNTVDFLTNLLSKIGVSL